MAKFSFGENNEVTVIYTCAPGFVNTGASKAICKNKNWSQPAPLCLGKLTGKKFNVPWEQGTGAFEISPNAGQTH